MDSTLLPSIISSTLAFISAGVSVGVTAYNQNRINKINQMLEVRKKHKYYLEPLIRSASDLQSRIYNILECGFIEGYYYGGNKRHQEYVINNTIFLFSQFFAWTEAARIDVQFIDLESDDKTRKLSELQDNIHSLIQTDSLGPFFMFFAGEQRAIGEKMLTKTDVGYSCIGYGEFIKENGFADEPLFTELKNEVLNMTKKLNSYRARLLKIQHALIDLINLLDPDSVRFNSKKLSKI